MENYDAPCGKVIHLSKEDAGPHIDALEDMYGHPPNPYKCKKCTRALGRDIWHVGYGYDNKKLNKKSRRHRKAARGYKKRGGVR